MSYPARLNLRSVLGHSLTALVLGLGHAAFADDDGERTPRVPLLPKYQQECAACHLAYPPGMLPVGSWQRLMTQLPHHFGSDASLDPASVKQLSGWLTANAGTYKRVRQEPPEDRITRSPWFIRKHDEINASTWKRASIKSAANCAACHFQADKGVFNDDDIRIPR